MSTLEAIGQELMIDRDELVQLALDLCNIDSPHGEETAVANFIYDWLDRNGFSPRKVGANDKRFNVVGTIEGAGGGYSLIFNSHMDTSTAVWDGWRVENPRAPVWHSAWIDGDKVVGEGIINDKGPMAAFMMAARAIKQSGRPLRGDLYITMSPGEIAVDPVDEFQGPDYLSHEFGAMYMVTHGVIADYALVAEGTNFAPVWVEAGKAWFKITLYADKPSFYVPFLPRPTTMEESPNSIVRAARYVERFEQWAYAREQKCRYECPGGTVIPKATIGAIRSGQPFRPEYSTQLCSLYADVRLLPGENPVGVRAELIELARDLARVKVEPYHYRRGHEAQNVGRLVEAISRAHETILKEPVKYPPTAVSSMWRDINVFNQMGIPALTYGPVPGAIFNKAYRIDDLLRCSHVYALTALDICNQVKPR